MGSRLILAVALVAGAAAFWVSVHSPSRASPGLLRAQTVEIVDHSGYLRVRIGVTADGVPSIRLYDSTGARRLELAVPAEGPAVTVFDGAGHTRQMLAASPGLEPSSEDEGAGP